MGVVKAYVGGQEASLPRKGQQGGAAFGLLVTSPALSSMDWGGWEWRARCAGVWKWEAQAHQLVACPLQLDPQSPGEGATPPLDSASLGARVTHVWTALVGLCSVSCGRGEAPSAPEDRRSLVTLICLHFLSSKKRLSWLARHPNYTRA